ncbi:hypothetical protein NQ318_021743 [Aromia moschata]|uniref:Uncharacterized protein n=1 Tax=Aromia moschata TaxID=1265417 RepID=A0AAV8XY44_9CUCU|nr:hypothetical protein NQ318_021743 [Aromia moschata]
MRYTTKTNSIDESIVGTLRPSCTTFVHQRSSLFRAMQQQAFYFIVGSIHDVQQTRIGIIG